MRKGSKHSNKTIEKMRTAHLGYKFSNARKSKMSRIAKSLGYGKWMKGKTGSELQKEIARNRWIGNKNPRWKGGLTNNQKSARWRRKNKDKVNYYSRLRKARRRGAGGKYTLIEWESLKKSFQYTCPSCGKNEPEIKLTVDHIVPISKGGSNSISNIQPLCSKCNNLKGTKTINYQHDDAHQH